ncbi:uncharacterized protein CELE_K09H11.11 [Caenorhabditis elegans]|uniref:Uncharacterized protein n=1 Tax=Caenorhabditis elegans TaxID=6239 RepID=Q4PIS2_CAEEL|nr:Uncharacterized protein CELE_K09H11.11 [Caenorhabditis elegans]CCD67881.2 Uncharacterized protein CELE_K09H11.11 [Caenorhabditis elegans]|eukprot:NP_001033495.2 Uncharacterized protein CELE_K09H11.11 [Caenorhabditis elegans]
MNSGYEMPNNLKLPKARAKSESAFNRLRKCFKYRSISPPRSRAPFPPPPTITAPNPAPTAFGEESDEMEFESAD